MLRVIIYQGSITVVVALVFMSLESANLMSSFYGGLIAVVNTLLLARSVDDAGVAAYEQKKARSALVLVRSVVTRFVIVLASFYVGIVHIGLVAIQILIAFSLAQLGYIFYKPKFIY